MAFLALTPCTAPRGLPTTRTARPPTRWRLVANSAYLKTPPEIGDRGRVNPRHPAGQISVMDRDQRPGLDELLKGMARREFDVVAAWSVDRLGRSLQDLIGTLNELRAKDVDLYLHKQGLGDVPDARGVRRVRARDHRRAHPCGAGAGQRTRHEVWKAHRPTAHFSGSASCSGPSERGRRVDTANRASCGCRRRRCNNCCERMPRKLRNSRPRGKLPGNVRFLPDCVRYSRPIRHKLQNVERRL